MHEIHAPSQNFVVVCAREREREKRERKRERDSILREMEWIKTVRRGESERGRERRKDKQDNTRSSLRGTLGHLCDA